MAKSTPMLERVHDSILAAVLEPDGGWTLVHGARDKGHERDAIVRTRLVLGERVAKNIENGREVV